MDLGLAGKVALVTGGARGIGAAIVRQLAAEGCDVAIVDRDLDPAGRLGADVEGLGRRFLALEADVSDSTAAGRVVTSVLDTLDRFDVLVCNAGIARDGMSWKMSDAAFDQVLAVNLRGTFTYARLAAAHFKDQRGGRIVAVASINGLRGKFGQCNYAAAKAGTIGLCKTLARELGKFDVTVNVVAPGMVRTEMTGKLPPEIVAAAKRESALGRIAEPEDVAAGVAFLCSGAARHITGEVVRVDGGQYL